MRDNNYKAVDENSDTDSVRPCFLADLEISQFLYNFLFFDSTDSSNFFAESGTGLHPVITISAQNLS